MRQAGKKPARPEPPPKTTQPERDAFGVHALLLQAINEDAATLVEAAKLRPLTGYEREALTGYYREVARSVHADREFALKYSDPAKMDETKLREELRKILEALPQEDRQYLLQDFLLATKGAQA